MKDILDDFSEEKEIKQYPTNNIPVKAIIYFLFMLIGGVTYHYYLGGLTNGSIYHSFYGSIIYILSCITISLLLEFFRLLWRKRKAKRSGLNKIIDPFWFLVWEGTFSIWLIFMFIIVVGNHIV